MLYLGDLFGIFLYFFLVAANPNSWHDIVSRPNHMFKLKFDQNLLGVSNFMQT